MFNGWHLEPKITMISGIEGDATACINETLYAYIQVDENEDLVCVCDGGQYRKFFQKFMFGPHFEYRLDVKNVSTPIIPCKFFLLMPHARQNEFVIEMQGPKKKVNLTFTKDQLIAASVQEQSCDIKYESREIAVKYRVRRVRTTSGKDEILFPCACQGKHDTKFISVGD